MMGTSGSSKSTLMNLFWLSGPADRGRYQLDGLDIASAKPDLLAELRNRQIGFVFRISI